MNLQNIVGHEKQINFLRNLTLDNLIIHGFLEKRSWEIFHIN